jgi:Flp pilus assembly protein TadD
MIAISDSTRLAISFVSGLAATITLIVGFVLEPNLRYWVYQCIPSLRRRGGRPPTNKPIIIWIIFWVSLGTTIIGTPIASFAPSLVSSTSIMKGELNIAIAEFAVNSTSTGIPTDAGLTVAQQIYTRISNGLTERVADKDVSYEIWSPDKTGVVLDEDHAIKLSSRINADILLYGLITGDGATQSIQSQFYVSARSFSRIPEFVGEHLLGNSIIATGTDDILARVETNRIIANRAQALMLVALGIISYNFEDYQQALELFTEAAQLDAWQVEQGKETVYLLIGNSTARLDRLEEARDNFESALAVNPEYARAHIGLAEVYFRHAMGNPPAQNPLDISIMDLQKAEAEFKAASSAADQPTSADIDIKVAFGLGRIALVRYEISQRKDYNELQFAQREFKSIVVAANTGNTRIIELAALSHGYLGTIAFLNENFQEAKVEYQTAIANTTSPRVKAGFFAQLGDLYVHEDNIQQAIKAYEQAVYLAPQDIRVLYEQKLDQLRKTTPR